MVGAGTDGRKTLNAGACCAAMPGIDGPAGETADPSTGAGNKLGIPGLGINDAAEGPAEAESSAA